MSAGFKAQHVPFKGAADSVTEIVAGRVDFSVQTITPTLPLIREGKLAALAVSSPRRAVALPDVPTTVESGLPPDSVYPFYSALYLPAKTPREIILKLNEEINRAMRAPEVAEKLEAAGLIIRSESPEFFADVLKSDYDKYGNLVKAIGFVPQ